MKLARTSLMVLAQDSRGVTLSILKWSEQHQEYVGEVLCPGAVTRAKVLINGVEVVTFNTAACQVGDGVQFAIEDLVPMLEELAAKAVDPDRHPAQRILLEWFAALRDGPEGDTLEDYVQLSEALDQLRLP
jgi:hypothetical protein